MQKLLFFSLIILTFSHCGKKTTKKRGNDVGPSAVDATAFSSANLTPLDQKTMEKAMEELEERSENTAYNKPEASPTPTPSTQTSDTTEKCPLMDDPIVAEGDTIRVRLRGDFGPCLGAVSALIFERVDKSEMKFAVEIERQCPGSDFSALNGKSIKDLAKDPNSAEIAATLNVTCGKDKPSFNRSSAQTSNHLVGKARSFGTGGTASIGDEEVPSGSEVDIVTVSKAASMGANGEFCKQYTENNTVKFENCWEFKRLESSGTYGGKKIEKIVQSKLDMSSASAKLDEPYLSGGVAKVTLNDWSGEINFDGTANPSWTMRRGSEEVKGKLGRETSLRLHSAQKSSPRTLGKKIPQPDEILRMHK